VRHRTVYLAAAGLIGISGLVGTVQLLTGAFTPPVEDLEPLGLESWVLPGLWLFTSVVVPWSAAGVLAWRRHPGTPTAVLVACGALMVELAVQIPFVGFSPFQLVLGAAAVVLGRKAWLDRRAQRWRPHSFLESPTQRPERASPPSSTGLVQGQQPMLR
jgi:hypothetical protein